MSKETIVGMFMGMALSLGLFQLMNNTASAQEAADSETSGHWIVFNIDEQKTGFLNQRTGKVRAMDHAKLGTGQKGIKWWPVLEGER
jgi:hypothetical protein